MNKINQILKYISPVLLFIPACTTHADVLVNVTAQMISPACVLYSADQTSPLKLDFGNVQLKSVGEADSSKNFSLIIEGCDFAKDLSIVLSPKSSGVLLYNGRNILATTIDGLGIDLSVMNNNTIQALEVSKKQKITPTAIDGSKYGIQLKADLVSSVPLDQLKAGPFSSSVTITVTYL
ncbi:fimbrial protein [Acinetobacter guerrae]|uniref:fimbrial protein n=1 Tax=Acinetobacter guerrae TaxID=1843371 RepID=UPI00128D7737|nr:fimbrial protein [Acinetobacter guerrae]MPW45426.1 hypothetical protein [Acinetobacter guerrae]